MMKYVSIGCNISVINRNEMATKEPIIAEENVFAEFDRVATQITDIFETFIQQLMARRDALLRELQEMKDDYVTNESTRKAAIEEMSETQQQLLQKKVSANRLYHQQAIDIYQNRIRQLETPIQLPLHFFSCPTLNQLTTAIVKFGEVKEFQLDYSLKKQPVLAVGEMGSADNELFHPTGLALDEVNQHIYIADRHNCRIQVVSFDGKFLNRFGQDVLKQPWGIAVTEDSVFVTDQELHAIFQFEKKNCIHVKQTGTQGTGEGQLDGPRGLCSDYNGDIYVADTSNSRVSVFSKQLRYVKSIGSQQLHLTLDVKVTPNNLVILDWSPKCIHFYSRNGDLLRSCVTQGKDAMVCNPWFFCLDTAGNILVTCSVRHDVKIFSPSGCLIHKIGKVGQGRGEFLGPCGTCVSESGTIFVISWNPTFSLQSF